MAALSNRQRSCLGGRARPAKVARQGTLLRTQREKTVFRAVGLLDSLPQPQLLCAELLVAGGDPGASAAGRAGRSPLRSHSSLCLLGVCPGEV